MYAKIYLHILNHIRCQQLLYNTFTKSNKCNTNKIMTLLDSSSLNPTQCGMRLRGKNDLVVAM